LQIALNSDQFGIADYLVSKKANIDLKDMLGMSALAWACKDGNLKIIRYLIEKGANVNSKNNSGLTILDIVTSVEIKQLLKKEGALTNEELFKKNTQ
jgi:ankyrin repeat protein